jgi:hypothetical protein
MYFQEINVSDSKEFQIFGHHPLQEPCTMDKDESTPDNGNVEASAESVKRAFDAERQALLDG